MGSGVGSAFHRIRRIIETKGEMVRVEVEGAPGFLPINLSRITPQIKIHELEKGCYVRVDFREEGGICTGEVGGVATIVRK